MKLSKFSKFPKLQKGFTVIELVTVMSIIAVLTVVGLPAVQKIQIEGRTPEVAKTVQVAIVKAMNSRAGSGSATPYTGASTAELSHIMSGETVLTVDTTAAAESVKHDLNKSGTLGTITFGPGTIGVAGDSGLITITAVDGEACPLLLNSLQKFVKVAVVGTVTLKDATTAYSGGTAQASCADTGNTLKFSFS